MSNIFFLFPFLDKGNPGDLPGLYSGSVAEYSKADTVIFRTDLFNLQTGEKVYPFKRTIKYDSKWLDKPNFVGSFELGDYVYFFFRESAVEYINCGKAIYSRIARVCKRDTGGRNILNKNWATFMWVCLYTILSRLLSFLLSYLPILICTIFPLCDYTEKPDLCAKLAVPTMSFPFTLMKSVSSWSTFFYFQPLCTTAESIMSTFYDT